MHLLNPGRRASIRSPGQPAGIKGAPSTVSLVFGAVGTQQDGSAVLFRNIWVRPVKLEE